MPKTIVAVRRRRPFIGEPRRAAAVVSARPPARPLVVAQIRRTHVGRGTIGRPTKLATPVVAKRPPAVLVAALRRPVRPPFRGFVGRPTKLSVAPAATTIPRVLVVSQRAQVLIIRRAFIGRPARAATTKRPPSVQVAALRLARFAGAARLIRTPVANAQPAPATGHRVTVIGRLKNRLNVTGRLWNVVTVIGRGQP
ncbi:hypothetical protein VT84_30725 [Gemmata sp. SH-PL17]|uniref:hypothetical protein n=1 Tax=Gemmata sp. SH-PL17 TaxID=1630693 RepID=UPI00078C8A4B|nr:hypothetical protein [Gemmata sp. SH-PL17]AMV28808.1 hypothetical protein VT84_30725 [Gemmata sp. SH-PL17]